MKLHQGCDFKTQEHKSQETKKQTKLEKKRKNLQQALS